jgi:hypothetical protein
MTADTTQSLPRTTVWIAGLFMVGSACFVVPSLPALALVAPAAVLGGTYFVGSIFFTSAALLVAATTWAGSPGVDALRSVDWWAAVVQFVGTLWFNLNTFRALEQGLTAVQQDLRIWTPDFLGSVCFLVSSCLSVLSYCHKPFCLCPDDRNWWVTALNLLGSVFFMLAALAAYVRPATGDLVDASMANTGTLLGGVCFFWAARLLLPARSGTAGSPTPA